jgi:hypothetical protein
VSASRASYPTPLGDIYLWGEHDRLASGAPVILGIPGAFGSPAGPLFRLQAEFPEAVALTTQIPGHLSPPLSSASMDAYAQAYTHLVETTFANRPVVVCGESVGGLIALAIPTPGIRRLALDPPLSSNAMWAAHAFFAQQWEREPQGRPFIRAAVCFDGADFAPFDYTDYLRHPARVVVGGVLPVRGERFEVMPSLVDAPERELMARLPHIQLTTVNGAGHVIAWLFPLLVRILKHELAAAVAAWEPDRPR